MARDRLPQLTATSTTEWMKAIGLRSDRLRQLEQWHVEQSFNGQPVPVRTYRRCVRALLDQTSASWWIENENEDLETILACLKASLGPSK